MNAIKCKRCSGHYVLRSGRFGSFFGCSTYPQCNSTVHISEFVLMFVRINGLSIYKWDKECSTCHKMTPVHSYYLGYDLSSANSTFLQDYKIIGIGDLPSIDKTLLQSFSHIKEIYSNTKHKKEIANTCAHCGSLQGNNYVVDDPHEIFDDLFFEEDIDKYQVGRINNIDIALIRPYIINFYGE